MRRLLPAIVRCRKGTAAAEMALVTPFLIILMFGAFELGNYFLSEHIVVKAVRDGARYASRQALGNYDCSTGVVDSAIVNNIQALTRTGKITGGTDRLPEWEADTEDVTILVQLTCEPIGTYSGIYNGMTEIPVVRVVATGVPYTSLFNDLGFVSSTLTLNAESQSAVMGI